MTIDACIAPGDWPGMTGPLPTRASHTMDPVTVEAITLGGTLRSAEWGDVRATECEHPAELRLPPHRHPITSVTYVLEGDFVESAGGRDLPCRPGAVFLKRSETPHTNRFGPSGARCLLLEIPESLLSRFEPADALFAAGPLQTVPGAAWSARRIHRELYRTDAISALVVEGLLLDLLSRAARSDSDASRPSSGPPPWLERVRESLHDRYASPPTLTELAAEADVHPDHLGRAFRRCYELTPGAYARRVRLEHAVRLITETDRPLGRIAIATGFSDQSHMTRQVKAATGAPPGRLRRGA